MQLYEKKIRGGIETEVFCVISLFLILLAGLSTHRGFPEGKRAGVVAGSGYRALKEPS